VYEIKITMKNVAEGDATDLAQQIWDDNAEALDAHRGEFDINISKDGFTIDWTPKDLA
jgi:hypothetical protein